MRLVRIDGLTPGGRALDLHARLTVLVGAPSETRTLLGTVFTALVDGAEPPLGGQVEIHGIRMALDRAALDLMEVSAPVDPVLDLGAPDGVERRRGPRVEFQDTAAAPPAPTPEPRADPFDPARDTREIAERDLRELRDELRSVTGERTVLGRRMESTRADLDSFARATLEVAIDQLDALEERRAHAMVEQDDWELAVRERRVALVRAVDELRAEHGRLASVDPTQVRVAADRLADVLDPPTEPDPVALDLAARLEDLVQATEELEARRVAVEGLLADAERRLAEAVEDAEAATVAYRTPSADSDTVQQLERVRDEIFELEERGGRLAAVRSKRRIDELRAEEAELLDRLGFDTYSSFVMGVPTARAEAERALRVDGAQSRVDVLQQEVDQLRADAPGGSEDQWIASERTQIVEEASALVGTTPDALARLTSAELTDLLRSRVLPPPPETSAEILSAAGRLASTMTAAGAPAPAAAMAPRAMLVMAADWLEEAEDRDRVLADLQERIDGAQAELARLDAEVRRADDGGRLADLDAEIEAVRARVADGEERMERHRGAMALLADLRTEELELRDRERDLLVRIGDRERLLTVLGVDIPPPAPPVSSAPPDAAPPGAGAEAGAGAPGWSATPAEVGTLAPSEGPVPSGAVVSAGVDREWLLLSRLGDVRSVSYVGSVPLLVSGIDTSTPDAPALMHRMHGMSELVQLLVLTDDERVARWAEGLGADAAVVHW